MNKNHIHVLSRAVVIDHDHILLYKTLDMKHNFYFLPGGHVEHGESAEEALRREMFEETGCEIQKVSFLGCLENIFENSESCKCHNHEYSFIFKTSSRDLSIDAPLKQLDKRMQLLWMPLVELSEISFKAEKLKTLIPIWLLHDLETAFRSVKAHEH